jgi:hypothetical protein
MMKTLGNAYDLGYRIGWQNGFIVGLLTAFGICALLIAANIYF